jgi:hypothetical protein
VGGEEGERFVFAADGYVYVRAMTASFIELSTILAHNFIVQSEEIGGSKPKQSESQKSNDTHTKRRRGLATHAHTPNPPKLLS